MPLDPKRRTSRLTLSIIEGHDENDIFDTLNHPDTIMALYFLNGVLDREWVKAWCERAQSGYPSGYEFLYIVRSSHDDEAIGFIGVHPKGSKDKAEIGYWIHHKHQGKGYASEMIGAMIGHTFERLDIKKMWASTAIDNTASQHLLEKFGFENVDKRIVNNPNGDDRVSYIFELDAP